MKINNKSSADVNSFVKSDSKGKKQFCNNQVISLVKRLSKHSVL